MCDNVYNCSVCGMLIDDDWATSDCPEGCCETPPPAEDETERYAPLMFDEEGCIVYEQNIWTSGDDYESES